MSGQPLSTTLLAAMVSLAAAGHVLADDQALRDAVHDQTAAFYCTAEAGEGQAYIFTAQNGGNFYMQPGGHPARRNGETFSVDLRDGTLAMADGAYIRLTSEGTEAGKCSRFDAELLYFWDAIVAANRGAVLDYFDLSISIATAKPEDDVGEEAGDQPDQIAKAGRTIERLRRENDKLKRQICELDPQVTFSACP